MANYLPVIHEAITLGKVSKRIVTLHWKEAYNEAAEYFDESVIGSALCAVPRNTVLMLCAVLKIGIAGPKKVVEYVGGFVRARGDDLKLALTA